MSYRELRITRYVGHERIYLYTREGHSKPYGLAFARGKVRWFASQSAIERIINKRARENHAGKKTYNARIKEIMFVCECGCGETCTSPFKTRKPKYKNDEHRARARAARNERKRIDRDKRKRTSQRTGNQKAEAKETQRKGKSNPRAGGSVVGGPEGGVASTPSSGGAQSRGLFADQPEPIRTKKRHAVGLYAHSEGTGD